MKKIGIEKTREMLVDAKGNSKKIKASLARGAFDLESAREVCFSDPMTFMRLMTPHYKMNEIFKDFTEFLSVTENLISGCFFLDTYLEGEGELFKDEEEVKRAVQCIPLSYIYDNMSPAGQGYWRTLFSMRSLLSEKEADKMDGLFETINELIIAPTLSSCVDEKLSEIATHKGIFGGRALNIGNSFVDAQIKSVISKLPKFSAKNLNLAYETVCEIMAGKGIAEEGIVARRFFLGVGEIIVCKSDLYNYDRFLDCLGDLLDFSKRMCHVSGHFNYKYEVLNTFLSWVAADSIKHDRIITVYEKIKEVTGIRDNDIASFVDEWENMATAYAIEKNETVKRAIFRIFDLEEDPFRATRVHARFLQVASMLQYSSEFDLDSMVLTEHLEVLKRELRGRDSFRILTKDVDSLNELYDALGIERGEYIEREGTTFLKKHVRLDKFSALDFRRLIGNTHTGYYLGDFFDEGAPSLDTIKRAYQLGVFKSNGFLRGFKSDTPSKIPYTLEEVKEILDLDKEERHAEMREVARILLLVYGNINSKEVAPFIVEIVKALSDFEACSPENYCFDTGRAGYDRDDEMKKLSLEDILTFMN